MSSWNDMKTIVSYDPLERHEANRIIRANVTICGQYGYMKKWNDAKLIRAYS